MKPQEFFTKHGSITAIVVVSAVLRFYHMGFQSPWMDELYTLRIADPKQTFLGMCSEINLREGFPYLYFILVKMMFSVFGYTIVVARSFSAIFGVASVFMIYRFGALLFNRNTGFIAAILLAFAEQNIYASQDARPYTFYLFAVLCAYYSLLKFIAEPSWKSGLIYGFCSALMLNTNFFALINFFAQGMLLLLFLIVSPRNLRLGLFKKVAVSVFIALLLFLPNIIILKKLSSFQSGWIPMPTNETFSSIFKEILGNSELTLFIFVPIFYYFLFHLFRTSEKTPCSGEILADKNSFSFILLGSWASSVVFCILLKSYLDTPITITRYFTSVVPVFFLVFGAGLNFIKNKIIRYGTLTLLISLMFINNVVICQYYHRANKTQFREAAEFVLSRNQSSEPVYTSVKYWFDYFFEASPAKNILNERASLEAYLNEVKLDSTNIRSFWYIDAHARPFKLSEDATKFLERNFFMENNFDGLDAYARHYILIKDAPKGVDISKFGKVENLKKENGDKFEYNVEAIDDTNGVITVSGWAFFEGGSANGIVHEVVFLRDNTLSRLRNMRVKREDIKAFFHSRYDLSDSGFSASINKSDLESGTYRIAIYVKDQISGKEGFALTDKVFSK